MVGRLDDVKEGDLYGRKDRRSFVGKTDTKNRAMSTGVRAPVVARKPGNAGGTNRTERRSQTEPSEGHEGRTGRSEGGQESGDAMTKRTKPKAADSAFRGLIKPENRPHLWWWLEPSVWTALMLTALEQGVKGRNGLLLCEAWVVYLETLPQPNAFNRDPSGSACARVTDASLAPPAPRWVAVKQAEDASARSPRQACGYRNGRSSSWRRRSLIWARARGSSLRNLVSCDGVQ